MIKTAEDLEYYKRRIGDDVMIAVYKELSKMLLISTSVHNNIIGNLWIQTYDIINAQSG